MTQTRDQKTVEVFRLLKPFWPWLTLSVLTGIAAGLATVALLATINRVLHSSAGMSGAVLAVFILLCAISLVGRTVSDIAANLVGQRLVADVRKTLAQKILAAPIDALERYRSYRLMPVLTQDVDMISDVAFVLASTLISVAVALGCLGYLAYLSPSMFVMLVVMMTIGTVLQSLAQARGVAGFRKARDHEEALHKSYRGISEGAKELRMHRERRKRLYAGYIGATVDAIRQVNGRAISTFVIARAFGSALFFLLIAMILGWAAWRPVDPEALSGFVLVLLFLKGPIDQILGTLPSIGRAKVAFQRIADLSARFATPEPHLDLDLPSTQAELQEGITLSGVRYRFDAVGDAAPFELGPINAQFRRGEMVFIVGDNGSGKTTLIKLLLGLYAPHEGQILRDGAPVTPQTRDDYRQLFTTVFSDFYLFEDLADAQSLGAAAQPYLERLEIAHKVRVEDGAFNTLDLSTGQRKRLALVHAYLEGRPVMVFDEWAADQDPTFRHLFYTELLPDLRRAGHLLIVISHDDRYFHVADRILRLQAGKMVQEPAQAVAEAPLSA